MCFLRHSRLPFTVTVWLTMSLLVGAQETTNRLTASDIFNLQVASDPQISPDGKRIVYVRVFADIMTDKRLSNLWIVSFDGDEHRAVTTGNFSDESPRWSPDGTRIAFVSDRDGTPQLYVRWMDTGQTAKLTSLENGPSNILVPGRQVVSPSPVSSQRISRKSPACPPPPRAPSGRMRPRSTIASFIASMHGAT